MLAIVAAAGSVLTAYVAVIAKRTEVVVNGKTAELLARVATLEELLAFSRNETRELDASRPAHAAPDPSA